ncbi:hypothetical protein [Cereibacter sphaeroides]|uniref:hypothetical protein n=1 Tax=Cereibacter sphaeroides TaxID=1063 RepID=UPI00313D6B23
MTIALSARVLNLGASVEACRHFLSIRLARWEIYVQHTGSPSYTRETDRPFALVTIRDGLGAFREAIVECPGVNVHLVNHRAVASQ